MEKKYWVIWWWMGERKWGYYVIDEFSINEAHQYKETEEHRPFLLSYSFLVVEVGTDLSTLPPPGKK